MPCLVHACIGWDKGFDASMSWYGILKNQFPNCFVEYIQISYSRCFKNACNLPMQIIKIREGVPCEFNEGLDCSPYNFGDLI